MGYLRAGCHGCMGQAKRVPIVAEGEAVSRGWPAVRSETSSRPSNSVAWTAGGLASPERRPGPAQRSQREVMAYNAMELMICCAARLLEDGRTVAVGTGVPCAAAMLAQRTAAPNLVILFEAGGVAPQLPTMPVSVGDSRTFFRAVMATSMADVMETCQRGMIDYTFLGGAQIDAYGNLNSTVCGDYRQPKVRFPGSAGAADLA